MSITQTKVFKPTTFPVGALMDAFDYLFKTYNDPETSIYFFTLHKLHEEGTETSTKVTPADLRDVRSFNGHSLDMTVARDKKYLQIQVWQKPAGTIAIKVSADDTNTLRVVWDKLVTGLSLEEVPIFVEPKEEMAKRIDGIEQRLRVLEGVAKQSTDPLQCFLSYRFTEATESSLSRFKDSYRCWMSK
jgi:hypothetical protein